MEENKKQERKAKIEESLSKIRHTGAALETALQNSKKKEAEERVLANPLTTEDAELQLPTFEKQLGEPMSEQDIIKRGTLLQKIKLYFTKLDFGNYFDTLDADISTDKIRQSLVSSIKTEGDKLTLKKCYIEYAALKKYGSKLAYYFKRYQTSFAILAKYLNMWESYEREANRLTAIYRRWPKTDPEGAKWFVGNTLLCSGDDGQWQGACLRFNEKRKAFYVDVELKQPRCPDAPPEKSLYSHIEEEAASTTEALSDFKAYAVVVEEFLLKRSLLKYMPISTQVTIENAEEERFTRYLVKDLYFFRSELNLRRSKGKTISKERKLKAVIADYYEVKPAPDIKADCEDALRTYLTEDS